MRSMVIWVSAVLLVAGNAAAAQAVQDAQRKPGAATAGEASPRGDPAALPATSRRDVVADDRRCLEYTGSHLTVRGRKDGRCVMANGRSYNREDIDRTGQTDLSQALRTLDPAVR